MLIRSFIRKAKCKMSPHASVFVLRKTDKKYFKNYNSCLKTLNILIYVCMYVRM